MRICLAESVCPFSKTSFRGMAPGQSVAGNQPGAGIGTLSRCSRTWARHRGCQRNHFLATAKSTPSTTADYSGACASETEQLDCPRDRWSHRSGASQRRLLGKAHRRWSAEISGASAPAKRHTVPSAKFRREACLPKRERGIEAARSGRFWGWGLAKFEAGNFPSDFRRATASRAAMRPINTPGPNIVPSSAARPLMPNVTRISPIGPKVAAVALRLARPRRAGGRADERVRASVAPLYAALLVAARRVPPSIRVEIQFLVTLGKNAGAPRAPGATPTDSPAMIRLIRSFSEAGGGTKPSSRKRLQRAAKSGKPRTGEVVSNALAISPCCLGDRRFQIDDTQNPGIVRRCGARERRLL